MYTLYYAPGTASFAVHWMLLELAEHGVQYELARVNLDAKDHKKADYLHLNPTGLVPTLVVDGKPMYETAALLMLLAERHAEAALNSDDRVAYLQWMLHLSNTVQARFRGWFHPEDFACGQAIDLVKESARGAIEASWDRVDQRLAAASGNYLLGNQISAADFLATMLMRWSRNMPRPATSWPSIAAYVARMKSRPSFRELYAREGLTEWA